MIRCDWVRFISAATRFMDTSTTTVETVPRARLFAAAALAMIVFGMLIAMLGALFGLPAMRERLGVDLAEQGNLFGILSAGLLVSSAIAGPAIDRFGNKPVLVSAAAMVTAALVAFATANGFSAAAAAALLLGVGGGWLNTASNAVVSDVFPEDRGRMLNVLGMFFGVGALFVPLVVAAALDRLSITGIMLLCAGVAGTAALASALPRFPPPREGASFSVVEMLRVGRDPGVLLLAVLLLFESSNESALSGWTSTYVGAMGWTPRAATAVLVGYWITAIAGRALAARAQSWMAKERLVIAYSILSIVGCAVLLASAGWLPGLALGALATSLGLSGIYPTVLAIAGDRYHRFAGTIFGFLFTVGNSGNILSPLALGHISQAFGLRAGMLVPLVGAVLVTLCALTARSARLAHHS
jgi:MFS transporter, FHS family, glucose/mannose:H+ symporter